MKQVSIGMYDTEEKVETYMNLYCKQGIEVFGNKVIVDDSFTMEFNPIVQLREIDNLELYRIVFQQEWEEQYRQELKELNTKWGIK